MPKTSDRIKEARREFTKDVSVAENKDIVNPMLEGEDEIILSEVLPDPEAADEELYETDMAENNPEEKLLEELYGGSIPDRTTDVDEEFSEGNNDDDLDDYVDYDEVLEEDEYDPLDEFTSDPNDEYGGFNLDQVLSKGIEMGASDVHINADDYVSYTVLGSIHRDEEFGIIDPNILLKLSQDIIPHVMEQEFVEELELDTYYVLKEGPHRKRRSRLSIGKSFGNPFMVFRIIADQMPLPEELGLEPEIIAWSTLPNGLILINGPTGTGKSTLISSLIKNIQMRTDEKIITIEKPVEFVYGTIGSALIVQREIGRDSRSFAKALDGAMRQAPDRIVVGEVRNETEVDALIRAAESGHWAISTIHASSSPTAINRIMSLFEGPELRRVLGSLADNIRGMANQVLLKTPDGKGRFGVREILDVNDEISEMIREGRTDLIRKYQIDNEITMEHALAKAVRDGRVTKTEARSKAGFPSFFDKLVKDLPEYIDTGLAKADLGVPSEDSEGDEPRVSEVAGALEEDNPDSDVSDSFGNFEEVREDLDNEEVIVDEYVKAIRESGRENPFINDKEEIV